SVTPQPPPTVTCAHAHIALGHPIPTLFPYTTLFRSVTTVDATHWSYVDPATHTTSFTYQVRVIDQAGNTGTPVSQAITIDTAVPTEALAITAIVDDTGSSSTDFVTSDTTLTVSGTKAQHHPAERQQIT